MSNVFDLLNERGFIAQCTDEDAIRERLGKGSTTFYIGFDATADSLTAGHFLTIMAMMHMQKAGHRPIALIGGGTTMIGDPSGKSDMRTMMTRETIDYNAGRFREQLSKFITFDNDRAIMVNNADWLLDMNYVTFLREVGVHFSVNKMLAAECYKNRMEKGLTFFEFNYMLMQSYDFYKLFEDYGCELELGGDDQWSNIIGGVNLVRRKAGKDVYGFTFKLLTTSDGIKMGKTMKGALWLDPDKTSPYEFFQYWRNIEDVKTGECLSLLTFLPMEEVRELSALKDEKINEAKERLAYEITAIVHGEDEAEKARKAAKEIFAGGGKSENMPTTELNKEDFGAEKDLIALLVEAKLAKNRSEGRRLIEQGGISVNDEKVTDVKALIKAEDFGEEGEIILQKGKKVFHRLVLK
ncbi:MAG: tyrosine--tRNA ligase [Lachnospiraceae bacterium]|nr:tyrosine--tRNA ligase [Lachnospiraceae bacterium]